MASRKMEFQFELLRADDGREFEVISVKQLCRLCGEWKDQAFDVCWHPDVPCKAPAPDEGV